MVHTPYTCCRCGYTTKLKANMRKHLYRRHDNCPATKNNIILTEELKNHILENRVYKLPTKLETSYLNQKIKAKTQSLIDDSGHIYIHYPRACKNIEESVYKIGKTHDYINRQAGYTKGGDMLFVISVTNRHDCENIVKSAFRNEFKPRRDYGCEYFEGDVFEMVLTIKEILSEYITETDLEFKFFK